MRRVALALVLFAGCSSDPIVGRWAGGREPVVFHDDGRAEFPINSVEMSCEDATAVIAACARRQRWARHGDHYTLTVAAVSRPRSGTSFQAPGPCTCGSETIDVGVHGDDLFVMGTTQQLHRAR